MRNGTWETVATIVCFSGLIAYMNNWYALIPMIALVIMFLGFGGGE